MKEMLLLSVVQLASGLILACALGLFLLLVRQAFGFHKLPVEEMYEFDSAETHRSGAWQYNDAFFNKITEFRNDFSGR